MVNENNQPTNNSIVLGVVVTNGKIKTQMNVNGTTQDLALSITMLEQLKKDLLLQFEKSAKKNGGVKNE